MTVDDQDDGRAGAAGTPVGSRLSHVARGMIPARHTVFRTHLSLAGGYLALVGIEFASPAADRLEGLAVGVVFVAVNVLLALLGRLLPPRPVLDPRTEFSRTADYLWEVGVVVLAGVLVYAMATGSRHVEGYAELFAVSIVILLVLAPWKDAHEGDPSPPTNA